MVQCPVCRQADITDRAQRSSIIDLVAKGCSHGRTFYEMRGGEDFSVGNFASAMSNGEGLPEATSDDKVCPYCRQGYVVRDAAPTLYLDFAIRVLGICRVFFETTSRPDFQKRDLIRAFVDGPVVMFRTTNTREPHGGRERYMYEVK